MSLFRPSTWFERAPSAPKPADVKQAPPGVVVSIERPTFGTLAGVSPRVNLDDLAARKTLAIYAKMRLDEQVKAATTFKRDAIVSRGWTFEWPKDTKLSDKERDQRKKVLCKATENMGIGFVDALNVISTGRDFGFSLTEKVYSRFDCEGKEYVGFDALLGRDPRSFNFFTDDFGGLIRCEQDAAGKRIPIDLAKFVHYVHNPEFDYYFGRSDLREAYRFWYFKDMMVRFWGIYMEKLGGGMVVASIATDANIPANSPQYTALQEAVNEVKASAGIILPAGVTAEVIFPQSSDAFEKACTFADLAIAKALLVPNLMGVSHTGSTGAYSQSQTQLETFAWTLQADAQRLETTVDKQVFRDLQDQNWGDGEYAQFKFKPLSTERLRWLVDTWAKLIGAGAVVATEDDEARLREILEMPPRDPEAEPLIDPAVPVAQGHELDKLDKQHQLAEDAKDSEAQRGIETDKARALDPVLAGEAEKDRAAKAAAAKKAFGYNPEQERDSDGKWSAYGATPRMQDHIERELDGMRALKSDPLSKDAADAFDEITNAVARDRMPSKVSPAAARALRAVLTGIKTDKQTGIHNGKDRSEAARLLNWLDKIEHMARFGYDPNESRDKDGKWTSGGGGAGGADSTTVESVKVSKSAYDELIAAERDTYNPDDEEYNVRSGKKDLVDQLKAGTTLSGKAIDYLKNNLKYHIDRLKDGGYNPGALRALKSLADKIGAPKFSVTPRQARIDIASAREKVDFAVIERKQTIAERELSRDVALIVARATAKELGDDAHLAALTDENTDDIGQIQFHPVAVGKIKVTTQKALAEAWGLGRDQAQREVRRSGKVVAIRHANLRDNAAAYFESNAFKVSGDVSDRARSVIQQELLTSVKSGRSPGQTRTAIWDRLVTLGLSSPEAVRSVENDAAVNSALDDLWKDTEEDAAHYLDTVARTNIYQALNEARYAEFTDPALGDFVMALRYSAVLDEHTTDICQALHDVIWKTDNELWDEYRPPNHFNCRSILVPVTAIDVEDGLWDGEESPEPSVDPQEGFGT